MPVEIPASVPDDELEHAIAARQLTPGAGHEARATQVGNMTFNRGKELSSLRPECLQDDGRIAAVRQLAAPVRRVAAVLVLMGSAAAFGDLTGTAAAAGEGPPEPTPVAVAPYFARLFVEEQTFWYSVVDDHIDDHSDRIVDRFRYLCTVVEVRRFRGAIASEMECRYVSPTDGAASDDVTETLAFVFAPGGLWLAPAMPATQEEVGIAIREPPAVPEAPSARSRTFERPVAGDRADRCNLRVEVARHSVCRDERCKVADGWGDTRERVCFTRGRGLESFRRENLAGAGTETWRLQRIGPVPTSSP